MKRGLLRECIEFAIILLIYCLFAFAGITAVLRSPARKTPVQTQVTYEALRDENLLLKAELSDKRAQLRLIRERRAREQKAIQGGFYLPLPLPFPLPALKSKIKP